MQRDINSVTLTGRVTKEPKLYEAGESVYALLRVAVHAGKAKDGKDLPTIYYDVKVWNAAGRACAQYLDTGARVAVEGRLAQYAPDDGSKEWNHVVASSVGFLDRRKESDGAGASGDPAGGEPAAAAEVFA